MSVIKQLVSSSSNNLHSNSSALARIWFQNSLAAVLLAGGVAVIVWGGHHLVEQSQVPVCVYPADENKKISQSSKLNSEVNQDSNSTSVQNKQNNLKTQNSNSTALGTVTVVVQGAVVEPGVYQLPYTSRVSDLIVQAGGLDQDADQDYLEQQLNLAQRLQDEQKFYIPFKTEKNIKKVMAEYCQQLAASKQQQPAATSEDDPVVTTDKVSINDASSQQLQTLTGVGPKLAAEIIQNRPFSNVDDLLHVSGVGQSTLSKFKNDICL